MTDKEATDMLIRTVADLGEHFDSVQIFVSIHRPDGADSCKGYTRGAGNWFSRYGQVREWITYTEEQERVAARGGKSEVS